MKKAITFLSIFLFAFTLQAQTVLLGDEQLGAERLTNSGAVGQTDWTDTNSDGLADAWKKNANPITSIVVDGADRYQRFEIVSSGFEGIVHESLYPFVVGKKYKVTVRYRGTTGMPVRVGRSFVSLPNCTTDFQTAIVYVTPISILFYITGNGAAIGNICDIDYISIKEVTQEAGSYVLMYDGKVLIYK